MEAIGLACLFAIVHADGGLEPLGLTPTVLGLTGVTLVLLAVLRETGSEGRSTAIVGATLGGGVLLAIVLPTRQMDTLSFVGRLIGFVIVAEVYLWRVVSLARGAIRWSDARNAVPFGAIALALAAVAPIPVDRGPLVPFALIFVAASAVALSVARSAEELSLTAGQAGPARISSANSVVFALGLAALIAAAAAPVVDQLLRDLGDALAPGVDQLIFYLLLPLGYLAAFIFSILEPILRPAVARVPTAPVRSPEEDEAMLREIERTRPLFIGGFEIAVVILLLLFALVILDRVVRERRLTLPDGAQLERASTAGMTLGSMLRTLLPGRTARRRAPHDDGTPAAAIRASYWRLLALADRAGVGWREVAETPAEHHRRIVAADARWAGGAPIVSAFEDLRYGEQAPDRATVVRAREALRAVEAATRT